MKEILERSLKNHKQALQLLENNLPAIEDIASSWLSALKNGGKIIFMGNGGSAADAQHLAAELIGRFKKNRKSLPAIAITTNTSSITAIANDFGFDEIFSRQIEALASAPDVVVGISTSGKSPNVIKAIKKANEMSIKTVGFLGKNGGELKSLVKLPFIISSEDTPRIQEMHILAGHIICEIVEENLT